MSTNGQAADAYTLIGASAERGACAVTDSETLRSFLDWVVEALRTRLSRYAWAGIYLVRDGMLVLQCYRGKPSPHSRIPIGEGICGAAVAEEQTIVVGDVSRDTRYLACSVDTRSEIVVPVRAHGAIVGEIDVDSDTPDAFGDLDRAFLETLARHVGSAIERGGGLPPEAT